MYFVTNFIFFTESGILTYPFYTYLYTSISYYYRIFLLYLYRLFHVTAKTVSGCGCYHNLDDSTPHDHSAAQYHS